MKNGGNGTFFSDSPQESHLLSCHLSTLSVSLDHSRLLVAGKQILKIYDTHDGHLVDTKLVSPTVGVHIRSTCWHSGSNLAFITASSVGVVKQWDLTSTAKSTTLIHDFKRPISNLDSSLEPPYLLAAGAPDGVISLFDVRSGSAQHLSANCSGAVNCVKWGKADRDLLSVCMESGIVQVWDLRSFRRCLFEFQAHDGPSFCADWHPSVRVIMATGGQDNMIKVWRLKGSTVCENYALKMTSPVQRMSWNPAIKYQLAASCSPSDTNIYVWNVRRKYVPYRVIDSHQRTVTGLGWNRTGRDLFSCSKDRKVLLTRLNNWEDSLCLRAPIVASVDSLGNMLVCVASNLQSTPSSSALETHFMSKVGPYSNLVTITHLSRIDDPSQVLTQLCPQLTYVSENIPMACVHNADVCSRLGLRNRAQVWKILGLMWEYRHARFETPGFDVILSHEDFDQTDSSQSKPGYYTPAKVGISPILGSLTHNILPSGNFFHRQLSGFSSTQGHARINSLVARKLHEKIAAPSVPLFKIEQQIANFIDYYRRSGDLVMAFCIFHLFHSSLLNKIAPADGMHLLNAFLDYSEKNLLWGIRSEVLKSTTLEVKNVANSLKLHTWCSLCYRSLNKFPLSCSSCRVQVSCYICGLGISNGLIYWCKLCQNGGHLRHFANWFKLNRECPMCICAMVYAKVKSGCDFQPQSDGIFYI